VRCGVADAGGPSTPERGPTGSAAATSRAGCLFLMPQVLVQHLLLLLFVLVLLPLLATPRAAQKGLGFESSGGSESSQVSKHAQLEYWGLETGARAVFFCGAAKGVATRVDWH
jgi:hypothetical protein